MAAVVAAVAAAAGMNEARAWALARASRGIQGESVLRAADAADAAMRRLGEVDDDTGFLSLLDCMQGCKMRVCGALSTLPRKTECGASGAPPLPPSLEFSSCLARALWALGLVQDRLF